MILQKGFILLKIMNEYNEKLPDPKEIEKEVGDFLAKRFGGSVKVVSPMILPREEPLDEQKNDLKKKKQLNFNLKPEELVSYLNQYIIKQNNAKAVLATKICTHFNRIKHSEISGNIIDEMVGSIKNNILMIGPTGVGKTYMIKLIAKKIGVPFVKGDATKFSETGYVGKDVEDLIRDLVREADDDIELAQYGIVYIDEIDKIASTGNFLGADISRTGVQRALLKPMEETDVDLKVPHDPISMIQEIEMFRKTGKRSNRSVNTKNILFIMSGAFGDLTKIIKKRIAKQNIGFGADIINSGKQIDDIIVRVKSEDLIEFGFESEFVGRLPVRAVFEKLTENDLFEILKNPSNPIILGKKLDFAAYGIDIKFEEKILLTLAKNAFNENTGARGLVSAVEKALLLFEKKLPSTNIKKFPVTHCVIEEPNQFYEKLISESSRTNINKTFEDLTGKEQEFIKQYVKLNNKNLAEKHSLKMTPSRVATISAYYSKHIMDIGNVIKKIKYYYDEIKKIELYFFKNNDINIVLEEDAMDFIIEQVVISDIKLEAFYKKLTIDFEHGLKLASEKTWKTRFFITKKALMDPDYYISNLIKKEMQTSQTDQNTDQITDQIK